MVIEHNLYYNKFGYTGQKVMDLNITLDLTQKAYGQNVKLWNSPQKVQDLLQVSNLAKD